MSCGKYSPTVAASYYADQAWWERHKDNPEDLYDRDGYDAYGYNEAGVDRVGHHEDDYLADEDGNHFTYESVYFSWASKIIE